MIENVKFVNKNFYPISQNGLYMNLLIIHIIIKVLIYLIMFKMNMKLMKMFKLI